LAPENIGQRLPVAARAMSQVQRGEATMKKMLIGAAVMMGLLALAMGPRLEGTRRAAAAAPTKGISPEADAALRKMTSYLASLQSFRVQSTAKDEVVLKSGQKIDLSSQSQTSVQRPNKLRSEQIGAKGGGLAFFYDGKAMTLECTANSTYTTKPAPPTIDGAIDQARKDFQIEAPGADLLYAQPYDILTEQVKGGQLIGHETVEGVPVTHLAFQGEEVDWQIWIKDGPEPLPVWFSIITKTLPSQPEFEVHLSHWETKAALPASTFAFKAPPNGTRADTFPKTCAPPTTAER
jgi:hypothetical protein